MKVGLIARAEDRGLGIQSWEFYKAMKPDATLVVDMGELARGFVNHWDRYPDGKRVGFDGHRFLDTSAVIDFVTSVDVIYVAETAYDWRLPDWCAAGSTGLVVQVNPEFYRHERDATLPHPSTWWVATQWRMSKMPEGTRVVPVPAPTHLWEDGLATPELDPERPLRWVHVVGHRAAGDRNGTTLLLQAARALLPCTIDMTTQGDRLPAARGFAPGVEVNYLTDGNRPDRRDLYRGYDALVLPRRYGGLCLPALEAMAGGLMVMMPDCIPNRMWPGPRVPTTKGGAMRTHTGRIPLYHAQVPEMVKMMNAFNRDLGAVATEQMRARQWALDNDWDALRPLYVEELELAADRA